MRHHWISIASCAFLLTVPLCVGVTAASDARADGTVDFLDYFLQKDDTDSSWTIGGTDVRPDVDPDGTDTQTYILNKFSSSDFYEVFKVSGDEVQIRYEVFRQGGGRSWIRRFQEIGGSGKAPGSIWTKRFVKPGGPGFETRFRQDRFVFDEKTKSYVVDPSGSVRDFPNYARFVWGENDWASNNKTGFKLSPVLRMVSEWQREGYTIEMYDYAKGKGMVNWRWLERVSTLPPVAGDKTGRLFHCQSGAVYVESKGDRSTEPIVYKYDLNSGKKLGRVECMKLTSHWRPGLGEQWYVVYCNSLRDGPLQKRNECLRNDFRLPEWETKPGATIRDLPYVNTTAPNVER